MTDAIPEVTPTPPAAETPTALWRPHGDEFPASDFALLAAAHGTKVEAAEFFIEPEKRDGQPGQRLRIQPPAPTA